MELGSDTEGTDGGGGHREEEGGSVVDGATAFAEGTVELDALSDADLIAVRDGIIAEGLLITQQLGSELDPITFVSAQVHTLINELWPEERDRTIFDIKVHQEILSRLKEVGAEIRKRQLVEGVGMSMPSVMPGQGGNRAQRRQAERQQRRG